MIGRDDYLDANSLQVVKALETRARELGPHDPLTSFAYYFQKVALFPTLPLILLSIPAKNILGCAVGLTFGILLLPLSLVWLPFLGFLLGTSWLWLKVPVLRPFLIIPGALLGVVGATFVAFVPDMGERFQKQLKGVCCDSWPYSWLIYRLSKELYTIDDADDQPGSGG